MKTVVISVSGINIQISKKDKEFLLTMKMVHDQYMKDIGRKGIDKGEDEKSMMMVISMKVRCLMAREITLELVNGHLVVVTKDITKMD